MGGGGNGARLNRAALGPAVRYMAGHGITQFLDLGSGLPTAQNTHQIAQAVAPGARVVYVDNDPAAHLHGQALLADDASTTVVLADVRTPGELLARDDVRGFLDFGRPVGLILNAVIHHVLDEEDPQGIVDFYGRILPSGSYLQLTHFCDESPEARANSEVLRRSLGRGQVRSRAEITRFFDNLELIPPGVVYLHEWQPDSLPQEPATLGGSLMLCGVARKPWGKPERSPLPDLTFMMGNHCSRGIRSGRPRGPAGPRCPGRAETEAYISYYLS